MLTCHNLLDSMNPGFKHKFLGENAWKNVSGERICTVDVAYTHSPDTKYTYHITTEPPAKVFRIKSMIYCLKTFNTYDQNCKKIRTQSKCWFKEKAVMVGGGGDGRWDHAACAA